ERADIFSTGVLLYEMLTGIWPFQGRTSVDVRHAVLHEEPQPLSEARPGSVRPRLQQIMDRALARDRRARNQKASKLRHDLRAVMREVESGTTAFTQPITPVTPRHLSGTGRMGRALSWLRGVTGSEQKTVGQRTARATGEESQDTTPATSMGDRE